MPVYSINLVAVLAASVVCFILGWIWYSPLLFGNRWMKELGIKRPEKMTPEVKGQMGRSMFFGFLFTFLTSYVLAHFLTFMNLSAVSDVAQLVLWLWLGFTFPVIMTGYLWEKKTLTLVMIASGQTFVSLLVAGVIITSMSN